MENKLFKLNEVARMLYVKAYDLSAVVKCLGYKKIGHDYRFRPKDIFDLSDIIRSKKNLRDKRPIMEVEVID